jgi:glycosyltransferase involved in cell wall biosynthesis
VVNEKSCQHELAIVLPSLNPDKKFAAVVRGLLDSGFENIVIVDDGSDAENKHFFTEAAANSQCHLCTHPVNRGKGAALKTAFAYVLENLPEVKGVVTIDGDGQHLLPDVIACGNKMLELGDKVVLGCRDFNKPGIPPRSVAGNKTTSRLFRLCYGIRLSDTQTGLRAIPREYLNSFCHIEGQRFEYETNMLLQMKRMGIGFAEQPIETVYDPEDYGSHYNAIKDSWRIFKVMFKFMCSSVSSLVVDMLVFYLIMKLLVPSMSPYSELIATVGARICSSFLNFYANNKVVFNNKGSSKKAMLRYYCLCIPQMLVSAGLVTLLNRLVGNTMPIVATLIKMLVDTVLFFISYTIQREWVFANKKK